MPNKANARKALRQAEKRAARNLARKEAFKDAIKKAAKAISKEEALKLARLAQKTLDKAAQVGVIKRNTAARKLSRLMDKVHAMK